MSVFMTGSVYGTRGRSEPAIAGSAGLLVVALPSELRLGGDVDCRDGLDGGRNVGPLGLDAPDLDGRALGRRSRLFVADHVVDLGRVALPAVVDLPRCERLDVWGT